MSKIVMLYDWTVLKTISEGEKRTMLQDIYSVIARKIGEKGG